MHIALFCTVSIVPSAGTYKWGKPHTQLALVVVTSHGSLHNQLKLYKWGPSAPVYHWTTCSWKNNLKNWLSCWDIKAENRLTFFSAGGLTSTWSCICKKMNRLSYRNNFFIQGWLLTRNMFLAINDLRVSQNCTFYFHVTLVGSKEIFDTSINSNWLISVDQSAADIILCGQQLPRPNAWSKFC